MNVKPTNLEFAVKGHVIEFIKKTDSKFITNMGTQEEEEEEESNLINLKRSI